MSHNRVTAILFRTAALAGLAASVTVAQTAQAYDNSALQGGYVFQLSGDAANPQGGTDSIRELGLLTADGAGNVSGSETLSLSGGILERSLSGQYTVNPDGTGSMLLYPSWGPAMNADIVVANGGHSVKVVLTDPNNALSGELAAQAPRQTAPPTYDVTSVNGGFDFDLTGYAYDWRGFKSGLITEVGRLTMDGAGNVTGTSTLSLTGSIIRRSFTGTYSINPDGTGSLVLYPSWGPTIHAALMVSEAGSMVNVILNDPSNLIVGVMRTQAQVLPKQ